MLKERLKKYNIILASKSPRRQQFLKDLDLDFSIELKEIEEIYPEHLGGTAITDYLAELKSSPFKELNDNDILITSDTIVWLQRKAIGKPKNKTEAIAIFKELSGNMHEVITSVCIKTTQGINIFNDTTKVFFKKLTDEEIINKYMVIRPFSSKLISELEEASANKTMLRVSTRQVEYQLALTQKIKFKLQLISRQQK